MENDEAIGENMPRNSINLQSKLDINQEALLKEETVNADNSLSNATCDNANGLHNQIAEDLEHSYATSATTTAKEESSGTSAELAAAKPTFAQAPTTIEREPEVVAILDTSVPQPVLLPTTTIKTMSEATASTSMHTTTTTTPTASSANTLVALQHTQLTAAHLSPIPTDAAPTTTTTTAASSAPKESGGLAAIGNADAASEDVFAKLFAPLVAIENATTLTQSPAEQRSSAADCVSNPQDAAATRCVVSAPSEVSDLSLN